MVLYHGALDYYVVKNNGKSIILLLDNHASEEYCKYSAENLNKLFENFLNEGNATVILEEVVGNVNYTSIFNSKHLTIFNEFYKKYKNNDNVISVDIRILVDKYLDKFFLNMDVSDNVFNSVLRIINETRRLNSTFNDQYEKLYKEYKTNPNGNDVDTLNLLYPFDIRVEDKNHPTLMSGILELYCISHILNSDKSNVFVYLGAAHCAVILKILITYYGFEIKRNNNLRLNHRNVIHYDEFEKLGSMCIDFTS